MRTSKLNSKKTEIQVTPTLLIGWGVVLVAVWLLWGKLENLFEGIKNLFTPDNYANKIEKPQQKQTEKLVNTGNATKDGKIIVSNPTKGGAKTVSTFSVAQANADADEIAGILGTAKGASWTEKVAGYVVTPSETDRIKYIINPKAPSAYRKAMIEAYRDTYTEKRSLKADVFNAMTGIFSNNVSKEIEKFFIL